MTLMKRDGDEFGVYVYVDEGDDAEGEDREDRGGFEEHFSAFGFVRWVMRLDVFRSDGRCGEGKDS